MTDKKVVIVDYAISNLFNVKNALEEVGGNPVISNNKDEILNASRVILPGVGAFPEGMKELYERNLVESVLGFARTGRPLLGICLGMQLLMDQSDENGKTDGLKIIPGKVERLRGEAQKSLNFKIPQIGWNILKPSRERSQKKPWDQTILAGTPQDPFAYFLHSYVVKLAEPQYCLAETHYGDDVFCSVFQKENIMGLQFHPERSGKIGLQLFKNFLSI